MNSYSIIQKSQLEGAKRLDAEYYTSPTMFKSNLTGKKAIKFSQYGTSKGLNDKGLGYPVLRLNEFTDYFIAKPTKYCNKINKKIFESLKLKKGDLLVCRTNGNPNLVGKSAAVMEDTNIAFASYLFRVRPKEKQINSSTLLVFLHSKFGRSEIEKHKMVSNQTNFSPAKFKLIKIPKFSARTQLFVQKMVNNSYKQLEVSYRYYLQAENLLLKELGLEDFKPKDELSYVINFSEIESANRMDAEYFQPKYKKLLTNLRQQKVKPLLNFMENIPAKFNPKTYPEKRFRYIELSNIESSIGTITGFSKVLGNEAPSRAKRLLKTGDVIVSSVEGSLEKVALVGEKHNGCLASTGFFQFRSKTILPEVLLILAKSIILQNQLKQRTAGTILTAVPKETIKNFLIPILSKPIQQKIANLIKKSHKARKKSKELLEKAKRRVEEMIEKGAGK